MTIYFICKCWGDSVWVCFGFGLGQVGFRLGLGCVLDGFLFGDWFFGWIRIWLGLGLG